MAEEGLASVDERGTTCCYAQQDKFWVQGTPNGEQWEIYTVLADSPSLRNEDTSGFACCGNDAQADQDPAAATAACC